jgi:hypothetical protein
MTTKTKGRNGGDRPTLKQACNRKPTAIRSSVKAAICRMAIWGFIPAGLAMWMIERRGPTDA